MGEQNRTPLAPIAVRFPRPVLGGDDVHHHESFPVGRVLFAGAVPIREAAGAKNSDLFHNGTAETNLGDLSAYLSKAYFIQGGNTPNMRNQMLAQVMTNIDKPLNEHARMAVEMMDADIAHNFKIKNLSSSIGISRLHLTSLFNRLSAYHRTDGFCVDRVPEHTVGVVEAGSPMDPGRTSHGDRLVGRNRLSAKTDS